MGQVHLTQDVPVTVWIGLGGAVKAERSSPVHYRRFSSLENCFGIWFHSGTITHLMNVQDLDVPEGWPSNRLTHYIFPWHSPIAGVCGFGGF